MIATVVRQGDQYALAVEIKQGDTIITTENCDDVKIKLGSYTRKHSEGELTYANERWYFPLTQEMTLAMWPNDARIQVQIKQGNNIYGSDVESVKIDISAIREVW